MASVHPPSCERTNGVGRDDQFLEDLTALWGAVSGNGNLEAILQQTLDAGMRAVGGRRGFLAVVHLETGELTVACVAGEGWTDEKRRLRLHLSQERRRGITGHVALTGRPYITGDVDQDPYYLRYFDDVKSEIAVPILGSQSQTRGVINIDSTEPSAFDAHDCAHLVALSQAASAFMGLDWFRARERALIEIGKNLTTTLEIEALMKKVVEVTAEPLRFEDCSVFLIDDHSGHLVLQASHGVLAEREAGSIYYHLGEGLTGWVAEHGQPVRMEDPHRDPRWNTRLKEFPDEEVGAFLAVPIVSRDKVLGVLRVLRRKSQSPWLSNRFSEVDERILTTIASQLGAAVENARGFKKLVRAERMAAWGELSAKSAHMIGNRTFALKGDLNELNHLLDSMSASDHKDEVRALVRSMESGIERLEEILREFRDFVVATQLTLVESDINQIVREVVSETFPKRSKVTLSMELAEGIPPVRSDPIKLKRAFSELIENSVSFQPEGGELRIRTGLLKPEERVGHRLAHSREYVQIEFADAGPGVSDEIKERIFQPFYTSRVKGMGLGLSIVKGIVEAHQGRIREVGEPGQGARFLVFLPVNGRKSEENVQ